MAAFSPVFWSERGECFLAILVWWTWSRNTCFLALEQMTISFVLLNFFLFLLFRIIQFFLYLVSADAASQLATS